MSDYISRASLVAQMVKNLPPVQETWVQSLDWEDPLEKEMQSTPIFLPGKFHRQRNLAGYSRWGQKESDSTEWLTLHFFNDCNKILFYSLFFNIIHLNILRPAFPFSSNCVNFSVYPWNWVLSNDGENNIKDDERMFSFPRTGENSAS